MLRSMTGDTDFRPLRRLMGTVRAAPIRSDAQDDLRDLAVLERRLAAEPALGTTGDLLMVRPSACALHLPITIFHPVPNAENCRELIGEIAADDGNHDPVLVRRITPSSGARYEILVGARRHFAVDWLNRNGRPELRLLARLVDISDEEAFRIAESENRGREDIGELVRARSYSLALDLFYGGLQSQMAAALGLSNSQLSRLLGLAEMPDEIIAAFASPQDLKVRHSEVLSPLLRREPSRSRMIEEAERIDAEQRQLAAAGLPLLPAALVLAHLRAAGECEWHKRGSAVTIRYAGEDVGSIRRSPDGTIQLGATLPAGASAEIVARSIEMSLHELRG